MRTELGKEVGQSEGREVKGARSREEPSRGRTSLLLVHVLQTLMFVCVVDGGGFPSMFWKWRNLHKNWGFVLWKTSRYGFGSHIRLTSCFRLFDF